MNQKVALIFITGQDGAYLAEILLNKNYIVHGVRRSVLLSIRLGLTIYITMLI